MQRAIHPKKTTTRSKTPPLLDEVLCVLRAMLPDPRQRYSIGSLGVFGSAVRGEQRPRSSIDVLAEFHRVPTPIGWAKCQP